ncbi:MAG: hypothetical protein AAF268_07950 [Cyanobacteria bacterium P01_A01_bin.3]
MSFQTCFEEYGQSLNALRQAGERVIEHHFYADRALDPDNSLLCIDIDAQYRPSNS